MQDEPELAEGITANVPSPKAMPTTGITTPDQVLPDYPRGTASDHERRTLRAKLSDWSGCLTGLLLTIGFGLAVTIFVLPVCQVINRSAELEDHEQHEADCSCLSQLP